MSTRRTNDESTYTVVLDDGTALCFRADHGMTFIDIRRPGARSWSSNRVDYWEFLKMSQRSQEIASVAYNVRRSA